MIVQYGGQTPLKLARDLERRAHRLSAPVRTRSTWPKTVNDFSSWIGKAGPQAASHRTATDPEQAVALAGRWGISAGGAAILCWAAGAMEIVYDEGSAPVHARGGHVSNDSPVPVGSFLNDAIEVDIDAICDGRGGGYRRYHGTY